MVDVISGSQEQIITTRWSDLPIGSYDVIYADPPWKYYGDPNKDQAAGKHYECMTFDQLAELDVRSLLKHRAIIAMWTTGTKMAEACALFPRWGCYYRQVLQIWIKTKKDGTPIEGQGVRPSFVKQMDEFLLIGSTTEKGRTLPIMTERMPQNGFEPRPGNVHSRKPALFRNRLVELFGDVRRVELFSREVVPGWDAWGNDLALTQER